MQLAEASCVKTEIAIDLHCKAKDRIKWSVVFS